MGSFESLSLQNYSEQPEMARTICISVNSSWNVWNFRRDLISDLISKGCRVVVVAPGGAHKSDLEDLGCKFITCPQMVGVGGVLSVPILVVTLLYAFRFQRIDTLLTFTLFNNIAGAICRVLVNIDFVPTVTGLGSGFLRGKVLEKISQALLGFAVGQARVAVFQNTEDQAYICGDGLPENRSVVIPGSGIDVEAIDEKPPPSGDRIRFLMVARVIPEKGVREFVGAARMLSSERDDIEFALVGSGQKAIGDAWLNGLDEGEGPFSPVSYYGYSDSVHEWIDWADCVVLPSYREGLSRVLLEGGAIGRPLLASNVPGCRDVIRDNFNGYLFEPRDVLSLLYALRRFLAATDEQRAAMGRHSRLFVEARFSSRIVNLMYWDLIGKQV